jgi:predicted nucleic acid-binding protein
MNRSLFADSWYYLAILNPRDARHAEVKQASRQRAEPVVTTRWVLTEVVDALSLAVNRPKVIALLAALEQDDSVTIVPADQRSWEIGMQLFRERGDKDWSLTDCISFSVMDELEIRAALTADIHFEQAGFVALFRPLP